MQTASTDLLNEIGLLPPPIHTPWVGSVTKPAIDADATGNGQPWPLFWYDPPWHFIPAAIAKQIVSAVDALKIPTAALGRDLGEENIGDVLLGHTMAPYRPDRYGLQLSDIQSASVIDVRLARARDSRGRYAYSHSQLIRWLNAESEDEQPLATACPAWIPAPSWPPELTNVSALAGKLTQLRTLHPAVRCAVSITPYRIQEELPAVLGARPNIIILRMDDSDELTGMRLAALIVACLNVIKAHCPNAALWVVPPDEPSPDDCVKMYALGVESIAIDWWCQPLINEALKHGVSTADATTPFLEQANQILNRRTERITGLIQSCGVATLSELGRKHLITASPTAAKRLGICL